MENGPQDIAERVIDFSLRIVRLFRVLEKDSVGRIIGKQLLRSSTSIGANVHEAQGGQSRADFIAKMSIAHKEVYETRYWLRIVSESELVENDKLVMLLDEIDQLAKILSSILISSKKNA